jgi:hypothetical protein
VAGSLVTLEKSNDVIGNGTRDLPSCNIVPQATKVPQSYISHDVHRTLTLLHLIRFQCLLQVRLY